MPDQTQMTNPYPYTPAGNQGYPGTTTSSGSGYGQSYVPGYNNLPQGISNAGQGSNNAYVGAVQPNQLVSNQLTGLLSSNSPYMDQARLSGLNTAASRGLLNSSIAAGNSQAAAIQAGLPIAQQDASTQSNLQNLNLQNLNQILATSMNNRAATDSARIGAGASMFATTQNNQGSLQRQREQLAYGGEQAGLNRGFQQYMSQLGYQQGLGSAAFNFAGQSALSNQNFRQNYGMNAMTNPFLMNDPNAMNGYMNFIGGDYGSNIDSLLNFSTGGF